MVYYEKEVQVEQRGRKELPKVVQGSILTFNLKSS